MPGLLAPVTSTGGADRQRAAGAAVGFGLAAGARAVGGLAEVDVGAFLEDEVGGALGAFGEDLDAGVDGGGLAGAQAEAAAGISAVAISAREAARTASFPLLI